MLEDHIHSWQRLLPLINKEKKRNFEFSPASEG